MKTLVVTVGEEMKPIYEGFRRIKEVKKVIYLASKKTEKYADNLKNEFSNLYDASVLVIDPKNPDDILEKLIKIQDKNILIEYNISGGTKIMSLSCFIIASFLGQKVYYVFKKDNDEMEFIELPLLKFNLNNIIAKGSRECEILQNLLKETLTLTEISQKLGLQKATVSGYIKKLEKDHDMIEKVPINRRSSKIKLTNSGRLTLRLLEVNEDG